MRRGAGLPLLTVSGRIVWPVDPDPASLSLDDIAHALSHLCRYNGHVRRFYCVTPDTRIITADLQWKPAGDLRVGEQLIGFDENKGVGRRDRRCLRPSVVTHNQPIRRRVYRLVLSDESELWCSAEHPWLIATKVSRNQTWRTAADLAAAVAAGRRRYLLRFLKPWLPRTDYMAGWLAGIFDGEGSVSTRGRSVSISFAQNPGPVLDRAIIALRDHGFAFAAAKNPHSRVINVVLRGGWQEQLRFLGTFQPLRLAARFTEQFRAGAFARHFPSIETLEIRRAIDEGLREVAGIETTTHTYLAEGFGAHNSVAEHSVHVSRAVPSCDALWGLLHDATEAYFGDLIRPVKPFVPEFAAREAVMMRAVARAFGLAGDEPPASVHEADRRIIADEMAVLLASFPAGYEPPRVEKLGVMIQGWAPAAAKLRFLERFAEIAGESRR